MPSAKKHRQKGPKRPRPTGWLTTDADEIERRRLRGLNEPCRIESQGQGNSFYDSYRVHSENGQSYRVEIRSLAEPINSCGCPDHGINGLGTCKHIEATLHQLQHRRKRAFRDAAANGSPFIEVFLDRRDQQVRIAWPKGSQRRSKAKDLLRPFFTDADILTGEPLDTLPGMIRAVASAHAAVRGKIRTSEELNPWLQALDRREQQRRSRRHFETEVTSGKASLDLLKHTLYPYQREGMLHLAFTARALLADEMGLGKTVQAVAACELLRRTFGIRRALVISPASLKGEWEEQIAKFTDLPSCIIQGPRAQRLRQYENPSFFFLANYEQMRSDVEEINTTLSPDVIILDEAQRIKNWQTKTAITIKRLKSPYAFVLTGTPIENRIDEIYSIVQFLDPHIFGPLFRFNREFYQLDEKGRAVGYRNLDTLHQRLQPIMLRRRKQDVEGQLPGRTVNTYFVHMHKEQVLRYGEYEMRAARLAAMAHKRPLTKAEMDQLQQYLACMRMLCDTPYILDQDCPICPKLKELGDILRELMDDGDHKIIVFSEWERMLVLVRQLAQEMKLAYAWHTGQVPQTKRRGEIRRFKNDPECRLFLSTDSGAVGLNLQVADVVINLDMPWNPAKLEQRIARAWRKHQKHPVQVINLVSEHTIEHRMLTLLEQKRSLAKGVVDGEGEKEMQLPSGRAAFLERLDDLMAQRDKELQAAPADPFDHLRDDILSTWTDRLELMELYGDGEHRTLMVVADPLDKNLQAELTRHLENQFPGHKPQLRLLDRNTFASIQQLIDAGILKTNQESTRTLYRAPPAGERRDDGQLKRLGEARARLAKGEHKQRMAKVLEAGGFAMEALAPMREAVETALHALLFWRGHNTEKQPDLGLIESTLVQTSLLPDESLPLIARLRDDQPAVDQTQACQLLSQSNSLLSHAISLLESAQ